MKWIIVSLAFLQTSFCQKILINQTGYLPDQIKYAYSSQPADSFFVIDSNNKEIKFKGKMELTASNDPATGLNIYTADFSSFQLEGNYYIKTDANDFSFNFSISGNVFNNVYKKSLKGFYFQRCGSNLTSNFAGLYARNSCHLNDGIFHLTTGKSGSTDETGGWHDAGDFGKYVVNAGITVGTLLLAYELFPEKFGGDNLNIPESGNLIPDLLDEVRYELHWLLKMQDPIDGGVYFKVTPQNFVGFIKPEDDNVSRYIYQKSSTASGNFAAVMSMAARIYFPFDSVFSLKCLTAAQNAWQYLENNPSVVPSGGFHNPSGTFTGEYGDGNDSDERLWAAAELFLTTGEDLYGNYYSHNYENAGLINSTMSWSNVGTLAQLDYLIYDQSEADSSIKAKLKNGLINYCTQLFNYSETEGFHLALKTYEYYWGSNAVVMNYGIILIIGYELSGNRDFYNAALNQLNYILGCNVHNISFVTNVGHKYPMHPHHRPSASDGIDEPVPGLLAGGPNKNLDDDVLKSLFNSSTPPALCYIDDQGSYASNEIAINWNAPLVFVSGYFAASKVVNQIEDETGSILNDFEIYQNFPNPFNPSTNITFKLNRKSKIELKVFSITGGLIKTLANTELTKGSYSYKFDAGAYASGVYFYRLKTETLQSVKKMVLIK